MGPSSFIVLILAAIAFSAGGILVAKFLVKGTKNKAKGEASNAASGLGLRYAPLRLAPAIA